MRRDLLLGTGYIARLSDGRQTTIRAARAGDEEPIQAFVGRLSLASRYQRFFLALRELSAAALDHLVHADPHEVALVALTEQREVVGLVQYVGGTALDSAEAAVVVADSWRRIGLAERLLLDLTLVAEGAGVESMEAEILRENVAAIALASKLGAKVGGSANGRGLVHVSKRLTETAGQAELV
jgi:acetyltransferase